MKNASLWWFSRRISSAIFATILAFTLACASKPDDAKVTSEIQSKFTQDSGLSGKQLNVQASGGVVTLSGNVDNDAQRDAAGRQAASVAGVKTVINNLQVGAAAVSAAVSAPPVEARPASSSAMDDSKPAAGKKAKSQPSKSSKAKTSHADSSMDSMSDNNQPAAASADNMAAANNPSGNQPAAQTPPPPPPAPKKLIIDQGTQVTVRLIDPIDSEKNQTGDTFHATLNAALTSDGQEAVPAGTELTGPCRQPHASSGLRSCPELPWRLP